MGKCSLREDTKKKHAEKLGLSLEELEKALPFEFQDFPLLKTKSGKQVAAAIESLQNALEAYAVAIEEPEMQKTLKDKKGYNNPSHLSATLRCKADSITGNMTASHKEAQGVLVQRKLKAMYDKAGIEMDDKSSETATSTPAVDVSDVDL